MKDKHQSACSDAIIICENYKVILRGERNELPNSETSILRLLVGKEINRIDEVIKNLKIDDDEMNSDEIIEQLKNQLETTTQELNSLIDKENDRLKNTISPHDPDEPDYLDHQTVSESFKLLEKTKINLD